MSSYDMDGRVVLITGATDGLGRALAREAAEAGATVLVHGRSEARIAETLAEVPGARAYQADLASLEQVRALAAAVRESEPRLDVLVSNAGIGATVPGGGEREESEDGYELRFAVNYLAGYVLTQELLDLLRASAPARIVNVASAGQTPIDFDDVMLRRGYRGVRAYCQSKLAQIISTFDLAEQLDGSGVTVNALHPATYMPTKIVSSPTSSLEEGVHATLRLIADPALEGVTGRYYDREREGTPDAQAFDPTARRWLRELSERLSEPGR
ncbi:MAG TPA: SDR family NAD(P)-dependent oxidoreductase [Solirubrobacteraceae bacterium]|jgi:NAD(P)-dependent dehydrogenase (short-subunit alcohol dehydrogenase family)|nr:SDR family NAD(P)-dependent oxidoreductase [Solirubrobacteraceae bacterium]